MENNYLEAQTKWVIDNNIEVGSTVKIVSKAKTEQDGWNNAWVGAMSDNVGKTAIVKHLNGDKGIALSNIGSVNLSYPYFVLEPVQ